MAPLMRAAAVAAALACLQAGGVRAEDVVLQNVAVARGGWTAAIARLEVDGSNLSQAQVASLFSAQTPDPTLLRSLKADRIVAPTIVATREGGSVTLHNLLASGVSDGHVKSASFESLDGSVPSASGGRVAIRSGAATAEGADLNRLIEVAAGGDIASGSMQVASLSWSDVVATFYAPSVASSNPGDESFKVSLASFKTQNAFDGDTPTTGSGEAKQVVVEAPAGSALGEGLKSFGYDAINAELSYSGVYDKAAKRFDLKDYTLSAQGAGSLGLAARFEGVDPQLFTGSQDAKRVAMLKAGFATMTIRYRDQGLVAKASDYFARQTKKTAAAVRAEWSSVAASLIPIMLNGAPSANALAAAVSQFITTPTSLTLMAKAKDGTAPVSLLRDLRGPQILTVIDLTATTGP